MTDIQYIYRLEPQPGGYVTPDGVTFVALAGLFGGLTHLELLRREFGWAGALRAVLKLASGSRALFGFVRDGRFVSSLWATEHSPRYPIESTACVLGPLLTRTEMRGRGLATALLRATVSCSATSRYRAIHIDTMPSNIASRRAIVRAGFVPFAVLRGRRLRKLTRNG
ncbi:MAG TPA: GNAT family protein [Rhizomicrobium sp.]|jgi:GNAT superfamily N-acetyltransferase|nr:GNAT family protein [Rhizomicrobium sp.]